MLPATCPASPCREEERSPLRPGKVSPMLEVPAHIPRPPYADSGKMPDWDPDPQVSECSRPPVVPSYGKTI